MLDEKIIEYIDSVIVAEELVGYRNFIIRNTGFSIVIDRLVDTPVMVENWLMIYHNFNDMHLMAKCDESGSYEVIFQCTNVNDLIEELKELIAGES